LSIEKSDLRRKIFRPDRTTTNLSAIGLREKKLVISRIGRLFRRLVFVVKLLECTP
jgi:hypothetical protein